VIPQRELALLRAEWLLDQGVIEKDYVLGWLLAGIAQHRALSRTWVFKGGTCLRKCYYETFRFSEDLDFTIVNGGPEEPGDLMPIFGEIAEWAREQSGIEFVLDDKSFQRKKNKRNHPTTQGRIAYRGPNGNPSLPKVKIDLTSDEILVGRPVLRPIGHPYSDSLPVRGVASYSITELFGEKLRALTERCRPRDLYDVVHMYRHPDLIGLSGAVRRVLERKCACGDRGANGSGHPVVTVSSGDRERVGEHARPPVAAALAAVRGLLGDAGQCLLVACRDACRP